MSLKSRKRKHDAKPSNEIPQDVDFICSQIEKLAKAENIYEAKSFLLFGNSLYPENFRLRFLKYKLAKNGGEYENAAACLKYMYAQFPNDLYNELTTILDDVCSEKFSHNKEMFNRLPNDVQMDILRKFSQTIDSPLDKATLLLVAIRNGLNSGQGFSSSASDDCNQVVQVLREAEEFEYGRTGAPQISHSNSGQATQSYGNPLNVYRMKLACDVLPLLHQHCARKAIKLDKRMLEEVILLSLQFYLSYATRFSSLSLSMNINEASRTEGKDFHMTNIVYANLPEIAGLVDPDSGYLKRNLERPWYSLRQVLDMAGDLLKWYRPSSSISITTQLSPESRKHNYSGSINGSFVNSSAQQLIDHHLHRYHRKMSNLELGCLFWVLFAETVVKYLRLARPSLFLHENGSHSSNDLCDNDFVDTFFILSDSGNHPDSASMNTPRWSRGSSPLQNRILETFLLATRLFSQVSSELSRLHEKVEVKLRLPSWTFDRLFFLDLYLSQANWPAAKASFSVCKQLYPKHHREFLHGWIVQKTTDSSERRKAFRHLLDALQSLSSESSSAAFLVKECRPADNVVQLVEFNFGSVFTLVIDLIIVWLHQSTNTIAPIIAILLSQYDLPHYRQEGFVDKQLEKLSGDKDVWCSVLKYRTKWMPYIASIGLLEHFVYIHGIHMEKNSGGHLNELGSIADFVSDCSDYVANFDPAVKPINLVLAFLKTERNILLSSLYT